MRIWLAVAAVVLSDCQSAACVCRRRQAVGRPAAAAPDRSGPSPITDRFYILGAFYSPVVHTDVRIDPTTGVPPGTIGTPVNAERDLGLAARLHQGRVEFMFRMRERNKLRVEYFEADRSAAHTLANTIVFGDQTFLAGQQVQTSINWRSFGLTYTYSLYRSDRFEPAPGSGCTSCKPRRWARLRLPDSRRTSRPPSLSRRCRSISPGASPGGLPPPRAVKYCEPRSVVSTAHSRTCTAICSTAGIPNFSLGLGFTSHADIAVGQQRQHSGGRLPELQGSGSLHPLQLLNWPKAA